MSFELMKTRRSIRRFKSEPPDRALIEQLIEAAITAVIAEVGATGLKDMGPTMAALKARYPGRMDFGKAGVMVKARLV